MERGGGNDVSPKVDGLFGYAAAPVGLVSGLRLGSGVFLGNEGLTLNVKPTAANLEKSFGGGLSPGSTGGDKGLEVVVFAGVD